MLKKKHITFVCIFVVLFLAAFFVFDSQMYFADPIQAEKPVNPDISIEDEEFEDILPDEEDSTVTNPDNENVKDDNQEVTVTLPSYTNGWKCLMDAYARLDNCKYYSINSTMIGGGSYAGITLIQKIKQKRERAGEDYLTETYAYSKFKLAKRFYETCTLKDGTYDYMRDNDSVDENFNYTETNNKNILTTQSYQEFYDRVKVNRFQHFYYRATQGSDRLMKFDKYSSKKYYIVRISMRPENMPYEYEEEMRREGCTQYLDFKSATVEFHISKTTGMITSINCEEIFEAEVDLPAFGMLVLEGFINSTYTVSIKDENFKLSK